MSSSTPFITCLVIPAPTDSQSPLWVLVWVCASIGICSTGSLISGVDSILRIGSAGGLAPRGELRDIVIGMSSSTDSNYPPQYGMPGTIAPTTLVC